MLTESYLNVCYQMIYRLNNNGRHIRATDIALLLTIMGIKLYFCDAMFKIEHIFKTNLKTLLKTLAA